MEKNEILEKLRSLTGLSTYVRVNSTHPLELYFGKSQNGFYMLRYNGVFQPVKIVGNELLSVKQTRLKDGTNSLMFIFNSEDNLSLFANFCDDIISFTENYKGTDGYTEIVNRYSKWRKMFYRSSKLLSEPEIMGLIGELLYLKDFAIVKYGPTKGLQGWSGPEPTHKDFSYDETWAEVKTISDSQPFITISSVEQLDSTNEGELVVFRLEKMSPSYDGIKLNALVSAIGDAFSLEGDRDLFYEKLKNVNYAYDDAYDNYVYNKITGQCFTVRDDFPKISAKDLKKGIVKVQYSISLAELERFKKVIK